VAPQGRHEPRLVSASPGLGWVELMWPGGTGTAPIIARRCWWPPQMAQVRREPYSAPSSIQLGPSQTRAALPRPELICSHRSLARSVDVSGLGFGGCGCFAAGLRTKQVGACRMHRQ
jgi:hypothetical protein